MAAGKFDYLTHLLLKNNHITKYGASYIWNALGTGRCRSLQVLNIHSINILSLENSIDRIDPKLFANAMSAVKSLQQLVVTRNKIPEEESAHMTECIGEKEIELVI